MLAQCRTAVDCAKRRNNRRDLRSMHHQLNKHGLLTQRQQEVIVGVANGMSTKQIAASLGISAKTAECHRVKLMHKLNLNSEVER